MISMFPQIGKIIAVFFYQHASDYKLNLNTSLDLHQDGAESPNFEIMVHSFSSEDGIKSPSLRGGYVCLSEIEKGEDGSTVSQASSSKGKALGVLSDCR